MEFLVEFLTEMWHRVVIMIILGVPLIALAVLLIFLQRKASEKEFNGVATQPRHIMWVGVISSVVIFVICVLTLIFCDAKVFIGMLVLWLLITLDAIYLALVALNWRIVLEQEGITYRNLFRRKRFYKYDSITNLICLPNGFHINIDGKKIWVSERVIGAVELHRELEKRGVYSVYRAQ